MTENPLFTDRPADCAALIDFRAECSAPAPIAAPAPAGSECTPVFTDHDCPTVLAQVDPTAGHPIPQITPQAPPIPGAEHLPHLPSLPSLSLHDVTAGLEVAGAFGATIFGVGVAAMAASWLFAWTPVRLRNMAFGSASIPGAAMVADGWSGPHDDVLRGAHEVLAGLPVTGVASAAVVLVPTGWAVAAMSAAHYSHVLETRGRKSIDRTMRAVWHRQQREMAAATRRCEADLPLVHGTLKPRMVIGRAARRSSVAPAKSGAGHLRGGYPDLFTVDWLHFREHFAAVGGPGSGKTTAMVRMIISFWATAWRMHQQWWRAESSGRPLAIILDLKGAEDAKKNAAKVVEAGLSMGMDRERIGVFPHEIQLSIWVGEAEEMRFRFEALIGAGVDTDGMEPAEAYYLAQRKAILHLVIDMPDPGNGLGQGENPPRTNAEFLRRMNRDVLVKAWVGHELELGDIKTVTYEGKNTPALLSERSSMATLFRELGTSLNGDRDFAEFDLVYCCLEGTKSPIMAKAQFAGLIAMIFALASTNHGRTVQLFVDEFAQVCGDDGAARTVELLRSAGVGSGWFTQSWMGLGPNDDARERLIDSCSGGVFVMRSYSAGRLAEKLGTQPTFAKSRKLIGGGVRHGDEGNVQPEESFIVPPAVLSTFQKGDIVHVVGGRATFGHVKELAPSSVRPLPGLAESTKPAVEAAPVPEAV
ncbi:hypothetical protein [Nocardia sp. NPDC004711]